MSTFLGWNGLRWLNALTAIMVLLVMVDAFIGHYRSGFAVRAQYTPFLSGGAILIAAVLAGIAPHEGWALQLLLVTGAGGVLTGIVGAGYHHYYGITSKPGGYGWLLHHLMHHAPPLAPFALSAVGALAVLVATGLRGSGAVLGVPLRTAALCVVAVTLAGAALQATLLHYRGAFNNPLMYAPLTTPVLSAAAVPWLILTRGRWALLSVTVLFEATFLIGFVGLGMHLRGFDRMMGGLRVALPNVLDGPAMTAPALFSGFAAAGLTALYLL
ncbi:MAG: hypothetical protein HOQ12_16325 [Gemmatimonadaceae bacterium]|nr:hypothetical protein [Gemmatimonadaceae bacterium]NUQ94073.1 hypothetical protein [Gemmatimonadaceae bacterium]NUR21102.1 hypothetical protein [Gemmatimonadaceae bacterium]